MAAFAKITPIDVKKNEATTAAVLATASTAVASNGAGTPAYGAYFEMKDADDRYVVVITNAHATVAKDATIKAGNALQGCADLAVDDITANGYSVFLTLESGRFKNDKENDALKALSSSTAADQVSAKGKVFIVGESTDIKVAVLHLV